MSDTAPLNPSNERSFPSYKNFYEKFESSKETKCTDSDPCGREVETYGLNSRNLRRHEAKIKSALAYIYKEYRTNKKSPESEARHFLYYWLGDKISKNAIEAKPNFHTAIRLICSAINSPPEKESCEIPCDNPTEAIFPHRKKIFDYTYDYDTIEKDLQTDDSDCKGKWSSYLEEIDKACTAVRGDCTTKTNPGEKEYCEKFEATYGVYCKAAKLPKMQCELKSTQEKMEREGQSAASRAEAELNEAVRSATTTSSLSSIIGTLGFTIAPFLLYKYKPWSSWFGNHSGNGRRGRNRRSMGPNIDTLTEGASTVDFTESSETSSTFDPTTVRPAIAYTRQSTVPSTSREGREGAGTNANNNTPGHHQRTNVGYGNM